ncbi:MAG: hypothetical protein H6662_02080 [Ardenticatenaceae bacterium]|nr:hypothetical protein [Ardenticatenaceae bacterium]
MTDMHWLKPRLLTYAVVRVGAGRRGIVLGKINDLASALSRPERRRAYGRDDRDGSP